MKYKYRILAKDDKALSEIVEKYISADTHNQDKIIIDIVWIATILFAFFTGRLFTNILEGIIISFLGMIAIRLIIINFLRSAEW
jgi:hypothetical protein